MRNTIAILALFFTLTGCVSTRTYKRDMDNQTKINQLLVNNSNTSNKNFDYLNHYIGTNDARIKLMEDSWNVKFATTTIKTPHLKKLQTKNSINDK